VNYLYLAAAIIFEVVGTSALKAVTLSMIFPRSGQRMIGPFCSQWTLVADQQKHCLLRQPHIEAPNPGQPLPILRERLGVIRSTREEQWR
jgi:hypothetical protein